MEVVVVGYGTQRKSDLTGAVATLNTNVVKQSAVSSFDKILQGTVSGVQGNANLRTARQCRYYKNKRRQLDTRW
jgi:surface antigen